MQGKKVQCYLYFCKHYIISWIFGKVRVNAPDVVFPFFGGTKGWINVGTPVSWEWSQHHWFKSSARADAARGLPCINYYGNHAFKKKEDDDDIVSLKSTSVGGDNAVVTYPLST